MKMPALFFAFILLGSPESFAQDPLVETNEFGTTDWQGGYVEATGQGTSRYMGNKVQEELMAKQAARTTAQARLLEIVKGIRLTGLSTLGSQAQGDTRAASRIKGTLKGAKLISENVSWHKDETSRRGEVVMAEVTLRLCTSPSCSESDSNLIKAALLPDDAPAAIPVDQVIKGPSAVIVDLNGALYLPALAPEIIDEADGLIYSQDSVDADVVRSKGLIHYTKTIDQAEALSFSGDNPLIVTAKRITKDNRIVLSHDDGKTLKALDALKNARVIISLD